ncbi:MAG TPA: DUF222 domain-containing protein [Microbacteriaceae bacterium]|nr:DUF222 domain-containing protein [Microbacteriaceae bacterium]
MPINVDKTHKSTQVAGFIPNTTGGSIGDSSSTPITAVVNSLKSRFKLSNLSSQNDDELISLATDLESLGKVIDYARIQFAGEINSRDNQADSDSPVSAGGSSSSGLGIAGWEDKPPTKTSISNSHGCKNAIELLQRITQNSVSTINTRIRLAQATAPTTALTGEKLPAKFEIISQALSSGLLNAEIATQLHKDLSKLPAQVAHADAQIAEANLVAAAIGAALPTSFNSHHYVEDLIDSALNAPAALPENADNIRVMTSVWVQALDQDGKEPIDEEKTLQQRSFNIGRTRNGLVPINGKILPEVAALIGRIVDSVSSPRNNKSKSDDATTSFEPSGRKVSFVENTASENAESDGTDRKSDIDGSNMHGSAKSSYGVDNSDNQNDHQISDSRSGAQKRHDALAILVQAAAKSEKIPNLGGAPVTVLVEVTEEALISHLDGTKKAFGLLHSANGEVEPISMNSVAHSACAGAIQKIVLDKNGQITEIGIPDRIFNANQRKAILLRDGGCVIPGCATPATWCEIHHVEEYASGGPTHTSNGVTLCWYHHRSINSSGWNIKMVGGYPWVQPPKWLSPDQKWQKHRSQNLTLKCT